MREVLLELKCSNHELQSKDRGMFQKFSKPAWSCSLMFLGFGSLVLFLSFYTMARFPSEPAETSYPTFRPRPPCTPVPDTLHPPIYPNALQVSITPNPTHGWLEVMYTTSFLTTDN